MAVCKYSYREKKFDNKRVFSFSDEDLTKSNSWKLGQVKLEVM